MKGFTKFATATFLFAIIFFAMNIDSKAEEFYEDGGAFDDFIIEDVKEEQNSEENIQKEVESKAEVKSEKTVTTKTKEKKEIVKTQENMSQAGKTTIKTEERTPTVKDDDFYEDGGSIDDFEVEGDEEPETEPEVLGDEIDPLEDEPSLLTTEIPKKQEKTVKVNSPKTGDTLNIKLIIALTLSFLGIIIIGVLEYAEMYQKKNLK